MKHSNIYRLLILSVILVLGLAACGGSPDNLAGTPGALGTGTAEVPSTGGSLLGTNTPDTGSFLITTGTPAAGGSLESTGTPVAGGSDLATATPMVSGGSSLTTETPSASSTQTSGSTTTTPAILVTGQTVTIKVVDDPVLGKILVNDEGLILYVYDFDTANSATGAATCMGTCLDDWKPLVVDTDVVTAGDGVDKGDLSVVVAYKDQPLYTYAKDTKPGDANGKNVGDGWKVAVP